jgi:acyl-coenzyme A synthetase/AMP-(fatty) acid ligase
MGATALILAADVTPGQIPLLLKRHDATIFAAAPGVYRKLLKHHAKLSLPRLRHGLSAGEKLSETLREHWQEATGTAIYEAYGLSECSTFISGSPDHPARPGTLGRPQDGRRVAILGNDGPVATGAEGTIAVHKSDPGLMLGYLGAPEATAAKFVGDWFLTGDQGMMDADGEITYLGRADDMMNAGGYRVSPIEVEQALLPHPGIDEVAVTDIEVKEDARVIMAFYTGPEPLDPVALDAFARERLAGYKAPRDYIHVDALPTGANGKLLRRALRPIQKDRHGQA